MAVAPALYRNLRFDPLKDFEHIGLFADSPMVILARKEFPPNTFEELVAWTKEKKEDLRFSAGGVGSATHLCALLYEQGVGVPITHVQYKGGAPALLDVRSGQVELLCDVTAVITNQVQSGDLKGYVLTARKRLDSLPNIRTSAEVGMPNLNVTAWYGLYAPAKTPKPIVERLSKVLQAVVQDPGVAAQLAKIDTPLFSPEEATPEAHRKKLASEIALWRPIIEKTGASAD
jgi:tripartite-type tricarboxylate transporter receptor subunit TctC